MIKIIEKDINELVPYENNARINDKAVDVVANSIEEFGFKQPIIIDKNNVIVAGHTRTLACKKLGITKVPCIVADDLTEEQIKAFRIADNSSAQVAEWDMEKLMKELDSIDYDMAQYGLAEQLEEIQSSIDNNNNIEEDDYEEPENLEPKVNRGEIYQLGEHRLMCGDSTKEEDVAKLMNGNKADMVFTDPPYNIEIQGGFKDIIGKQLKKTMEDIAFISDFEPKEFLSVLPNVFEKNKLNAYIFCNKELVLDYLLWAKENKFASNILVWKKPAAFPLADNHRCDIEYLLLFRKNAIWHNSLPNVNYSRCLEYSRVNKEKENANHPTPKPVELISQEIQISSNPNGIVVDFFGGSGSTLIACEQLNRKCFMMELDPHYISVIIERYIAFTGNEVYRLNPDGSKTNWNDIKG